MNILARLRARDPDLVNLRKAARAALVVAPLFALLKVALDLGPLSTYGFFACFVGLVYANFGGPTRPRAMAYGVMIVLCDGLIVVGSLLSDAPVLAAVVMFVIIFAVSFATIFGGYTPAFVAPVALSYSLSVLDPLSAAAIDIRVAGWTIGGAVAMVAGLALWPVDRRPKLRHALAAACTGVSTALTAIGDREAAEDGYRQAVDALADARRKLNEPLRPVGPSSRDVGLMHLVEHLEQAVDMTRRLLDSGWRPDVDMRLAAECSRSFRQSGDLLLKRTAPETVRQDIPRLDEVLLASRREADLAAIGAADTHTRGQDAADAMLADVRLSFPIMALAHIAAWVEANAATAVGAGELVKPARTTPELRPLSDRPAEKIRRLHHIVSRGLDPDGVIFRNSVRAGAAMTLAVVVAQLVPVEHGFWVTLAALLVLHSSAASTSATALQAVAGTLIGFGVAALILAQFGNQPMVLWILLPLGIFLAAYTPGVVSFLTGQVAFTYLVVVLFTLIDPVGIATAVARLETVALGAASGAVMAFILWPHGARVALARSVAAVYRVAGAGLRTVAADSAGRRRTASANMHGARRHAEEAFAVALSERGQRIDTRAWIKLFRPPNTVQSLVGGLLPPPAPWLADHCGEAIAATAAHRDLVADALERVADRLDPPGTDVPDQSPPPQDAVIPVLVNCIDRARRFGPDKVDEARRLIALNDWLSYVDEYLAAVEPVVEQVAAASRPRAWLRWSLPKARRRP